MKKLNLINFELSTIFGYRIYEIIKLLKGIYFNDSIHDNDIIDQIRKVLSLLKESGQEYNLGNLKVELFEMLMKKVIKTIYNIDLKKLKYSLIQDKEREYEYNYILETENEYIIFELKGYGGIIKNEEYNNKIEKLKRHTIKYFFEVTYPSAKEKIEKINREKIEKIKERMKESNIEEINIDIKFLPLKKYIEEIKQTPKDIRVCYITTGQFDKDALEVLENNNKDKPKNLDIYYDNEKLMDLLKKHKLDKELKIIEEFYKPYKNNELKLLNDKELDLTDIGDEELELTCIGDEELELTCIGDEELDFNIDFDLQEEEEPII